MSHDITGAAFSHRPAWHGLGTVVPEELNVSEAMRHAGLTWGIEKRPLRYPLRTPAVADGGEIVTYGETNSVALVRDDTEQCLGVATDAYTVVQNLDHLAPFAEAIVDLSGGYIESALELGGGKDVVLLVRLREWSIGDDPHRVYLVIWNGNDGSSSFGILNTTIRVVCRNTFQMALREGRAIRLRHTSSIIPKLDHLANVIAEVNEASQSFEEIARRLAGWRTSGARLGSLFERSYEALFPFAGDDDPKVEEQKRERWERRKVKTRDEVAAIQRGPHTQTEATLGTSFGLFNAWTEWLDFEAPKVRDRDRARIDAASLNSERKRALLGVFEAELNGSEVVA